MKLSTLCFNLCILQMVVCFPATAQSNKTGEVYSYYLKGKQVYLTPAPDEIFAIYSANELVSSETASSLARQLRGNVKAVTSNDVFKPANGIRWKVNAGQAGTAGISTALLKELRGKPNVEAAFPAFKKGNEKIYVSNKITFVVRPGSSAEQIEDLLRVNKSASIREINLGSKRLVVAKVSKEKSVFEVSSTLYESGLVEYAEPEFTFTGTNDVVTPNDPGLHLQWYLNNAADADIDAPEAWGITTGSSTVVVAVIDGHGFDLSHPDLLRKTVSPYNANSESNNPAPENEYANHGTPCIGLIAAATNNHTGVAGAGYNVKTMPVCIGYNAEEGGLFYTNAILIADAASRVIGTPGVVAVSNSYSFGAGDFSASVEESYVSMRQNSRNGLGAVILGSTANQGMENQIRYPAGYASVIGVGASTRTDKRASFSNYGTVVDVVAPGEATYTTDRSGAAGYSGGDYTYFNGTSAACPIAASVVGIMASVKPNLNRVQLESLLQRSCDKVGGYTYRSGYAFGSWNNEMGYGRVNAFKAAQLARDYATTPVPANLFRINAGGNATTTADARKFATDSYFSGGVASTATTAGISGTGDDYLYQTGRHGSSFAYNFPTGNGSFDVVLHFAETYFGNTAPGGAGSRKFHVNLEGVRKLTDYDVFAKAGGALRVTQETFRVTVSDGTLNVNFLKGTADNPAVKAIEVLPAGTALTINAGGAAYTSVAGKKFSADSYYASGSVSSIASGEIANTTDDALYRNARVGEFSYNLPSGNGSYDVVMHFAETYFGSRTSGGAGSRKFNVFVENVKRLSDYDIFAKAGGAMRAVKQTIRVTVTDGVLNLRFAKGTSDNPLVSAIEVIRVPVTAKVAAEPQPAGAVAGSISLHPNPVTDRLTIRLPFPAHTVETTAIVDAAGNTQLLNAHRASGERELQIEAGNLSQGLYLLRIDAQDGYQVLRFVKQ